MKKFTLLILVALMVFPSLTMAQDGTIRNERNQIIGKISPEGIVRSATTNIGTIKADGTIRNRTTATGKITAQGSIRNNQNQVLGQIDAQGVVRNERNQILGKIHDDGSVRNARNQSMGMAPGIKKEWVAVFFFFDFFD